VPQNIRHHFHSIITAEFLSDEDKVERDKNDLEYVNIKQKTPIFHRPQTTLLTTNPDHTKISNDLRTIVCRDHPVERRSHSKTVHNGEIFTDHQQDDKQSNL
jgi:hypothetical protein